MALRNVQKLVKFSKILLTNIDTFRQVLIFVSHSINYYCSKWMELFIIESFNQAHRIETLDQVVMSVRIFFHQNDPLCIELLDKYWNEIVVILSDSLVISLSGRQSLSCPLAILICGVRLGNSKEQNIYDSRIQVVITVNIFDLWIIHFVMLRFFRIICEVGSKSPWSFNEF